MLVIHKAGIQLTRGQHLPCASYLRLTLQSVQRIGHFFLIICFIPREISKMGCKISKTGCVVCALKVPFSLQRGISSDRSAVMNTYTVNVSG